MKKILLSLFALLALGGANSAKAETIKLYSTGFTSGGGNVSYSEGKLSWKGTGDNVYTAITAEAGVIAQFSTIHFTCSGLTEGATYRVMITTSDGANYISEINSTGDVTVNFSDLTRQWGSAHPDAEIMATITTVRIGGGTSGSPTAESPYELTINPTSFYIESVKEELSISSTADWSLFSKMVAAGVSPLNAQMTADVDAGSTMVGTSAKPYQGTFDGAGHTLTFNYDGSTSNEIAPFQYINNATINNLTTAGSINAQNIFGGIVGTAGGASTLNYCSSYMVLTANHNGDSNNGRVAGLVGRCADNATPVGSSITFNNCMFGGRISSTYGSRCCGLVSWARSTTVKANNCLIAPTSVTNGAENIAATGGTNPVVTPTNCYYTKQFGGSTQGTSATAAQIATGQLCYALNENSVPSTTYFFGQGYLNSSRVEDTPSLTSDASKKVYKQTGEERYANANGMLPDPALNNNLAWKFEGNAEAKCVYMLPAEKASNYTLYGTSDTYILRVTSAEATTLVLPFDVADVATDIGAEVKAYSLTFDGSTVTASRVNYITADNPVLINAPEEDYTISSGKSHDFNFEYATKHTSTTNGALTGVYCTNGIPFTYVPKDAYVLQNGEGGLGFYQVANTNEIKITSFRAYLTAPGGGSKLRIVYDDATAIDEVKTQVEFDGAIYDLQGRKVAQPTKGIYVKNGRKFIVK